MDRARRPVGERRAAALHRAVAQHAHRDHAGQPAARARARGAGRPQQRLRGRRRHAARGQLGARVRRAHGVGRAEPAPHRAARRRRVAARAAHLEQAAAARRPAARMDAVRHRVAVLELHAARRVLLPVLRHLDAHHARAVRGRDAVQRGRAAPRRRRRAPVEAARQHAQQRGALREAAARHAHQRAALRRPGARRERAHVRRRPVLELHAVRRVVAPVHRHLDRRVPGRARPRRDALEHAARRAPRRHRRLAEPAARRRRVSEEARAAHRHQRASRRISLPWRNGKYNFLLIVDKLFFFRLPSNADLHRANLAREPAHALDHLSVHGSGHRDFSIQRADHAFPFCDQAACCDHDFCSPSSWSHAWHQVDACGQHVTVL